MIVHLKQTAHAAFRTAAAEHLVQALENLGDRNTNLLRVLTYHRIDEPTARPNLDPGIISAVPSDFAKQMEFLAEYYRPIGLAEVWDAFQTQTRLLPRAVLITFDDAYQDFAEQAWPVLRRLGLPVVLFVPTAYPDQPQLSFWWDRLYRAINRYVGDTWMTPVGRFPIRTVQEKRRAYRCLAGRIKAMPDALARDLIEACCEGENSPPTNEVLGWNQLRQLAAEGVILAPHGRSHCLLNRVSIDRAREEIVKSSADLKRETGSTMPVLAYPNGGYNDDVLNILRREGIQLAFSTCRGINTLSHADPLRLRRINVSRATGLTGLRAQLLPCARFLNVIHR